MGEYHFVISHPTAPYIKFQINLISQSLDLWHLILGTLKCSILFYVTWGYWKEGGLDFDQVGPQDVSQSAETSTLDHFRLLSRLYLNLPPPNTLLIKYCNPLEYKCCTNNSSLYWKLLHPPSLKELDQVFNSFGSSIGET